MKSAIRLLCLAELLCISLLSQAQILKNIGNRVKQKLEQRADQKVDKSIDKGLDSSLKTDPNKPTNQAETGNQNKTIATGEQVAFETYSKFDFIPGDKVIAYDDFSQDAIGDFPVNWNTNSSGEVIWSARISSTKSMAVKQLSIHVLFQSSGRLRRLLQASAI